MFKALWSNRVYLILATVLLGAAALALYLNPAIAAFLAFAILFIPALVGLLMIIASLLWELHRNGTVDFFSKEMGFSTPYSFKEVTEDEPGEQQQAAEQAE